MFYSITRRVVEFWAWLGGALLIFVSAMTAVSVLGRSLLASPVLGDFEITELCCAMAIFMFFPLAQWHNEHTIVDIFTQNTSPLFKRICRKVGEFILLITALVLLWRMTLGALELKQAGEVTMILGLPRYLSFPSILISLFLLSIVLLLQLLGLASKGSARDL